MNSARFGRVVARLLWLSMLLAHRCNLIQLCITNEQRQRLQSGGLVVYANHPSMIETLALRYVLNILTTHEVWTITDYRVFPAAWLDALQAVPVCRTVRTTGQAQQINARANKMVIDILSRGGLIVVYPEGTRTCKAADKVTNASGTKQVGMCKVTFLVPAAKQGATLIPVWIEHGDCSVPQGFAQGYIKLLRGIPIILKFGSALTKEVSPTTVADSLLSTADQ